MYILSELSEDQLPTVASSRDVQSLFIATIALRFVKPAKLGGNAFSPHPLILRTATISSHPAYSSPLHTPLHLQEVYTLTYRSAPSTPPPPPNPAPPDIPPGSTTSPRP